MEFHIKARGISPDLDVINDALTAVDPSAMADIDPADASLRIAAEMSSPELLALLTRVGYPVDWTQLEQVPSVCCGACGGRPSPHELIALAPQEARLSRLHWPTGYRRERASWITWKPCARRSVRRRC
jgi:hypothetical protein